MAKRKLKKSVKLSLLGLGILFGSSLLLLDNLGEEKVSAKNANEVVEEEKKLSHNELWGLNQELAENHEEGFGAFYLYSDEDYGVFMRNSTKERYFVPLKVLEESYVIDLEIGDNVELVMSNYKFDFIKRVVGKSVQLKDITVENVSDEMITYDTGEGKIVVLSEFIEAYDLENPNIGSMDNGYFFDGMLVGVK